MDIITKEECIFYFCVNGRIFKNLFSSLNSPNNYVTKMNLTIQNTDDNKNVFVFDATCINDCTKLSINSSTDLTIFNDFYVRDQTYSFDINCKNLINVLKHLSNETIIWYMANDDINYLRIIIKNELIKTTQCIQLRINYI